MTAPIVNRLSSSTSVEPLFGYRAPLPIASRTQRPNSRAIAGKQHRDRLNLATATTHSELPHLWSRLLETLPQGVIIVSRNLQPVYWNLTAKKLCQVLADKSFTEETLPAPVAEACYSILRDSHLLSSALMMECQTSTGHFIRLSAQVLEWSTPGTVASHLPTMLPSSYSSSVPTFIAVFLENCDQVLQQEARIQQQKYDLTDREAEIWALLRQELTYQEIARTLQISLNTVKTHVKNVYAKRRSGQGKHKFWI